MGLQTTINPYDSIGIEFSNGLNSVITYLSTVGGFPTVAIEDLVTGVTKFIENTYYGGSLSTQQLQEINSISRNAINSYNTNLVLTGNAMYNGNQMPFVNLLIGAPMTANTAPASVGDVVADIEDVMGTSQLTVNEQTPLFLATTIGTAAFNYWSGILAVPGLWINYLSTNPGQNYMNTLLWDVAAMNGALAGYGASFEGLVEPNTNAVTNRIVSALAGALTASAGKVIFNWAPRITRPLIINTDRFGPLMSVTDSTGKKDPFLPWPPPKTDTIEQPSKGGYTVCTCWERTTADPTGGTVNHNRSIIFICG